MGGEGKGHAEVETIIHVGGSVSDARRIAPAALPGYRLTPRDGVGKVLRH